MEWTARKRLELLARLAARAVGAEWASIRLSGCGPSPLQIRVGATPQGGTNSSAHSVTPVISRAGERLGVIEAGATGAGVEATLSEVAGLVADAVEPPPAPGERRGRLALRAARALAVRATGAMAMEDFLRRLDGLIAAEAAAAGARRLADLAAAAFAGFREQARWQGPDQTLTAEGAQALSAALREMADNALAHGALSRLGGRVEVIWATRGEGGLSLEWLESGGPPTAPPAKRGFGLTLLENPVAPDLIGPASLNFAPGGLHAHVEIGPAALARINPADAVTADEPLVAADLRGKRILVVEDSVLLAMELEAGLTGAGAVVVGTAAEVDEALAMMGEPMDAAVLDARLNGHSVEPVAAALRARGIPFIFATGYAESAEPLGFDAPIVRKPYNVSQVIVALGQAGRRAIAAA